MALPLKIQLFLFLAFASGILFGSIGVFWFSQNQSTTTRHEDCPKYTSFPTPTKSPSNSNSSQVKVDHVIHVGVAVVGIANQVEFRMVHRTTWIRETKEGIILTRKSDGKTFQFILHPLFFVGHARTDTLYWDSIMMMESEGFGDIVMLNITENMNDGKTWDMIHWFTREYNRRDDLSFVIKFDSDNYAYWPKFLEFQILPVAEHGKTGFSYFGRGLRHWVSINFEHDIAGGQIYGISMGIATRIADLPASTCVYYNDGGTVGEDTQAAAHVVQVVQELTPEQRATYRECIMYPPDYFPAWVHAGDLKQPNYYFGCHVNGGCKGSDENNFQRPPLSTSFLPPKWDHSWWRSPVLKPQPNINCTGKIPTNIPSYKCYSKDETYTF